MKKCLGILFVLLLISSISSAANAAMATILDDYDETGNIEDVIHIGDQDLDMVRPAPSGTSWEALFALEEDATPDALYLLNIDHYQADPSLGYFNHIYLNEHDLGFLSADSAFHWYTESFLVRSEMLNFGSDNIFRIESGRSSRPGQNPNNYDDVEFTNITLTPIPAAFWLLFSGLAGFISLRRTYKE